MLTITLDDVVKPYLHLPTAIQTALIRVETHPTFRALTKGALKVLKTLVTRASSVNGMATIRARVDRMAEEAKLCEKTVQRSLRKFAEFDWVHPMSDGRSEYGVFESKRYVFTPALCELIALPTKCKPSPAPAQETQMSDGAIYVDLSLKKDLQEISIKNREGQPPTLPPTVTKIPEETGISATGVCKLLGVARRADYKLEDVYLIAKPYLEKIGTNAVRCYRYLHAMLVNPKKVDYAGKAAQERRNGDTDPAKALAAIAAHCRFKRYYHVSNGIRVRFFDGTAEVSRDGNCELYAGTQMQGLYKGIANGNLVEVIE
ncbi:hypothetical protein [Massilia genomosp. 1]|uniref:Replication protein n=1 Tax=Massilia genomosp. 1 TaxID=2609280 RepID=A0ABX0N332_9BURK|nr:hypothetical protein [Massilia genomosp. 1]NHZ66455.1 hypothetical protein [Massilia genomosp. 1]